MRIQITGSRDFTDLSMIGAAVLYSVTQAEGKYTSDHVVVHGGAKGADNLAGKVATGFGYKTEVYPADWDRYGKSAGYRRNAEMIALKPDVVLAFKKRGSGNKGTQHTIDLANKAGIPVLEYWEE